MPRRARHRRGDGGELHHDPALRSFTVAGNLRIHGGELGGRRLLTPRGIRPSQGVVKEAIYNVLAAEIEGAAVIDLFAGSGALGIEALSRGAQGVAFVETDPKVAGVLRRNLADLGLFDRSRVHVADARRWIELHGAEVAAADLILLDPPYSDPVLDEALILLDPVATGTVVVEWARRAELPVLDRLVVSRDRSYGATRLTILKPR